MFFFIKLTSIKKKKLYTYGFINTLFQNAYLIHIKIVVSERDTNRMI